MQNKEEVSILTTVQAAMKEATIRTTIMMRETIGTRMKTIMKATGVRLQGTMMMMMNMTMITRIRMMIRAAEEGMAEERKMAIVADTAEMKEIITGRLQTGMIMTGSQRETGTITAGPGEMIAQVPAVQTRQDQNRGPVRHAGNLMDAEAMRRSSRATVKDIL